MGTIIGGVLIANCITIFLFSIIGLCVGKAHHKKQAKRIHELLNGKDVD